MTNIKLQDNIHAFDRWAKNYDFTLFQFWMKKFHRPVFEEVNSSQLFSLLDLSCGTGEFFVELKKRLQVNAKLVGVDISTEMLAIAKKKVEGVTFLHADVHQLPFRDSSFDYVVSTEAFHHYYNQERALQEMRRVVKKGGNVIVVDINFLIRGIHWLFEHFEPGCVKVNSRKEIKFLFQKCGLINIKQRRSTFLFAVMTIGKKIK